MLESLARIQFHSEQQLVVWHPEGILDLALATQVIDFLTFQEKVLDEAFNRFANLEGVTEVHLTVVELNNLAARRRATYGDGPRVKSAFLATSLACYGIAWLFSILMEKTPIEVQVFRQIESAAKWLNVPERLLQPE